MMLMTVPGNSATSPPNAQARSRGIRVYLVLSFLAICLYVVSRARACFARSLSVLQVLRGQHGLAAARGGASLGVRRSSQRSLCAASLLHRDQAQSRDLQVRHAL